MNHSWLINETLGLVRDSEKRNKEKTEMGNGCNYRQQDGSCDGLLATAAIKLEMFERSLISE
jgi:hypothetical protein